MILVGLTGGIGAGKSTLHPWVAALGWEVLDADRLAREVVEPGQVAFGEVVEHFGPQILGSDGGLDRAKLAAQVFADPEQRRVLEKIVHRQIHLKKQAYLKEMYDRNPQAKVVYLVPLLFERNLESQFQATVLIELDPEEQLRRLVQQRGMEPEDAKRRMSAQMPLAEKLKRADFVVNNNGPLEKTQAEVEVLFTRLAQLPQLDLQQVLDPHEPQ
ncbi:MAG: dephospho-CoA kinase [Candidatus Lambdaproteobacteria bacterium RIFOXYD1_FULL_56_27]|uniref:Dephospho-CoA kinase n=1 Tax=Candidatus Lambdaproteobacteria bacterium RIFOXYD2_FULL_56_26 TaxID=1817773 RepID=A0A1F6H2S2_9PROT|nr:MAG: dephospho-CoA kinase [Candidatus Lambdaproteobacteria bacterium RIFOXYC1_FULL_56_13]OGH04662.1 MAG: dephospho-CoA kinase [Candidatus Lambdaproteobacteria bacterium RIFOXYD2_FULL_56_26]OGH09126.1 MAG: dephospho-CoA kinase [Candidatus Lambdaproteobacteria bacterium RIFOXYD1_FULL_56_27]